MTGNAMKRSIADFFHDEDAQAMVEYILIACMLILASYGAIKLFTHAWKIKFNKVKSVRSGIIGIAP